MLMSSSSTDSIVLHFFSKSSIIYLALTPTAIELIPDAKSLASYCLSSLIILLRYIVSYISISDIEGSSSYLSKLCLAYYFNF